MNVFVEIVRDIQKLFYGFLHGGGGRGKLEITSVHVLYRTFNVGVTVPASGTSDQRINVQYELMRSEMQYVTERFYCREITWGKTNICICSITN